MEKVITFNGQLVKVGCDQNCQKAFGILSRPRIYAGLGNEVFGFGAEKMRPQSDADIDFDDYAFLTDDECPAAPVNPGTYEGGEAKPVDISEAPNKWCVRECERCAMTLPGEWNKTLELPDFTKKVKNKANG